MELYSLLEKSKADPSNCVPRPQKRGNGNGARDSAPFEYAQGRRDDSVKAGASGWDITFEFRIVGGIESGCDAGRLPGVLRLLHGQFGANPLLQLLL
jgi:hypothetical protein